MVAVAVRDAAWDRGAAVPVGGVEAASAANAAAASDIGGAAASESGEDAESSSAPVRPGGATAADAAAIADGPFDRRGSGDCTVSRPSSIRERAAERIRQP
ncbi:hypothetical protein [Streptomyces sp. NPDC020951]|uniref:hypothetical protein n=1 Tax=Streptomyces sp. NPDC020951 TaxID=3365104 RepID=UPI0037A1A0C5